MNVKYQRLLRRQLDIKLKKYSDLKREEIPPKGWIRSIRESLGMNLRQLAERLSVDSSRVYRIEQEELTGSLKVKTLEAVAEALDCVFVYTLVPRTSLERSLYDQASCIVKKRLNRVNQTMRLEGQELSEEEKKAFFDEEVRRIVEESSKKIWDK